MAPTAWLSPHSQFSVWLVSSVPSARRYHTVRVASFSKASPLSTSVQPSGALSDRSWRVVRMATSRSPGCPCGALIVSS